MRLPGSVLFAALLAGLALAEPARAQPAPPVDPAAPPAPAPVLVPPRPLTPLTADYPAGAEGDASVVLLVAIEIDGHVSSARPETGAEPFTTAAVVASSAWRFEPATRDGVPKRASIRVEVRFVAPKPITPDAPPSPLPSASALPPMPPGSSAEPPPPPPPPIEVNVRGTQVPPGATSLSRAEVRLLPGAFGDPFRAIETLPGVTPLASGVPFFYVRGAPPGNVGYFLDGIRVPLLYHIGAGPSVIHPSIIDRVDLYPGGYPARFGRYAGGIVSGETKAPPPEVHAEGSIRVVDAGAMVEAPFADGRGSVYAAGRYSYTGALLSAISSDISLDYWDYQARASYRVTPRDEIGILVFGAHDFLGQKNSKGQVDTLFDTTFHRADLRYERRLGGPDDRLRQAVTLGWDTTHVVDGGYVRDRMISARTEITKRATDEVLIRAGLDSTFDAYEADLHMNGEDETRESFASLFSTRAEVAMGARADAVIDVTPRFQVTPGLRLDLFESGGDVEVAIDPRLAAKLSLAKRVRLVQAYGLASQPPSFFLPGPGFQRGLGGGLQRSLQASVGVEADLPLDIDASVTVFRNAFFDMTDPLGTSPVTATAPPSKFDKRSLGTSTGLEVTVRRRLTRTLGGFVSYTLSRSVRWFDKQRLPSSYDRTHVLNVAATYDFGRGYRAGARFLFYTGYPQVITPYLFPVRTRLPPFYRFDVRLEKKWTIRKTGWISAVIEVLNTTLHKEALAIECTIRQGFFVPVFKCENVELGPVTIPSIGIEGGF